MIGSGHGKGKHTMTLMTQIEAFQTHGRWITYERGSTRVQVLLRFDFNNDMSEKEEERGERDEKTDFLLNS